MEPAKTIDRYMELVQEFPLKPLHDERDREAATAVLHRLLDLPERTPDEQDYLHVLGRLIHEYDTAHHPMAPSSPAELLAFLIEHKGVNHQTVAEAVGMTASGLSHVLNGR